MEPLENYRPDIVFKEDEVQKITQRILNFEKILKNIPLTSDILKKEVKLASQNRIFYSCRLSFEQHSKSNQDHQAFSSIELFNKQNKEAANYNRAEEHIKKNLKSPLNIKFLQELQNLLEFGKTEPEFDLFNPLQLNIAVYIDQEKARHLKSVLDFINEDTTCHPLIKSWILHFEIARTAPLPSGNEKLARILQYFYLYQNQFHLNGFLNLEGELFREKTRYFNLIKRKFTSRESLNQEINFGLEIISKGIQSAEKALKLHYYKKLNYESLPVRQRIVANYLFSSGFDLHLKNQHLLVPRQKKILDIIIQKGFISTKELVEEFGCNRKTIQRDFAELMEMNLVKSTGNGSALKYTFTLKDKENEDLEKFQTLVLGSGPQQGQQSIFKLLPLQKQKRFDFINQTS